MKYEVKVKTMNNTEHSFITKDYDMDTNWKWRDL